MSVLTDTDSATRGCVRALTVTVLWWTAGVSGAGLESADTRATVPDHPRIRQAIARGLAFLLKAQNRDGSWGSARRTKGLNVYAPVPGAHQAFRGAITSLCVSALAEVPPRETKEEGAAIDAAIARAESWLFKNLPRVRRATPDTMYNLWTCAYSIQALVRLFERAPAGLKRDAVLKRAERISAMIDRQMRLLETFETVDGGWNYYDFRARTRKPSGKSSSFVNAAVLVAIGEARDKHFPYPKAMVDRAVKALIRTRTPAFTYMYNEGQRWRPFRTMSRPTGALGRTQACHNALRMWGDPKVTDEVISAWLTRLYTRNGWLSMGRKRPVPHESWAAVAGYYYYFAHYYATRAIHQLPPKDRPLHQARLSTILMGHQEKDGSWWDYPFYDYHQAYGTAFALMSLKRCMAE